MKIALLGYGKMGRAIEEDALAAGHEIVLKISRANPQELTPENLRKADVAIEFSTPDTVSAHIQRCFEAGIPVIIGTTGWHGKFAEIQASCLSLSGAMLNASNFSIGVNIFFRINSILAGIMNGFPEYEPSITEVHHIHKLDSPSGTAITIAEDLLAVMERKKVWQNILATRAGGSAPAAAEDALIIHSERRDEVKGMHSVTYISENDQVVFSHEAFNRKGFAQGAVLAAEWIIGKKGVFSMSDLLGFKQLPH